MALILTGFSVGYYFLNRYLYQETPKNIPILYRKYKKIQESKENEVESFKILQFNTLAKSLCFQGDFKGIDFDHTDYELRFPKLMEIILQSDPDIFCLVEMDQFERLSVELKKYKYKAGIFLKKNGEGLDGTCIFWKFGKVELLENTGVALGNGDPQNAFLTKFKFVKSQKQIVVCATHLKAKKPFAKKREEQGKVMMEAIKKFNSDNLPVVLCGDFNDVPKSLIYDLVTKEYTSTYSFYYDTKEEPYTVAKKRTSDEEIRCIDYIFYKSDKLYVKKLLEVPNFRQELPHLLPSIKYPSDHLSIAVEFGLE